MSEDRLEKYEQQQKERMRQDVENAKEALAAAAARGVAAFVGYYCGSGDSGGFEYYYEATDLDGKELCEIVWGVRDGSGAYVRPGNPDNSIIVLLDSLVDQHHGGWENNEGGFGYIVLTTDGRYYISHDDYIQDTVHSTDSGEIDVRT